MEKHRNMDYRQQLLHQLDQFADQDLRRRCVTIDSAQGPIIRIADGTDKVLLCSNNYLNLAEDERIRHAAKEAIDIYGFGAVASRLVSGTMTPHVELENRFAEFLHKEASLFFSSGWTANQALLTTLPQKGDLVLIDRLDHASIIDAVKSSEADFRVYRRNLKAEGRKSPDCDARVQPASYSELPSGDFRRSALGEQQSTRYDKLKKYLADSKYKNRYIVTESVFSMDGDIADLAELVALKKKYGAVLIVDEAHALGCFGKSGAGLCEQTGVLDDVDIIVAPLGKAVATGGGIVAGPKPLIDYLINKARPFIYTTAPSPIIAAAAAKALEIIQNEPDRRQRLADNSCYLHEQFQQMGLNTANSTTQIIPVILGESAKAVQVSRGLYDAGFFVSAIRPPTVAPGTARLRISLQANHTQTQLDNLCKTIRQCLP